jgi:hypothetical protein
MPASGIHVPSFALSAAAAIAFQRYSFLKISSRAARIAWFIREILPTGRFC